MSSDDTMKVIQDEQRKAKAYRDKNNKLRMQLQSDLSSIDDPDQREQDRQRIQAEIDSNEANADQHDNQVQRLTAQHDQELKAEQEAARKEQEEMAAKAKKDKRKEQLSSLF